LTKQLAHLHEDWAIPLLLQALCQALSQAQAVQQIEEWILWRVRHLSLYMSWCTIHIGGLGAFITLTKIRRPKPAKPEQAACNQHAPRQQNFQGASVKQTVIVAWMSSELIAEKQLLLQPGAMTGEGCPSPPNAQVQSSSATHHCADLMYSTHTGCNSVP
jgi:hypothetical protein